VIEKERANTGRFVEIVGQYNPRVEPVQLKLNWDRIEHWIGKGAQPSATVRSLIDRNKPAASSAA